NPKGQSKVLATEGKRQVGIITSAERGETVTAVICFSASGKATKEDPVLLLFDGHSSHTKNLPVINAARENGVILLCFPPHCSHKLQPCDVSFMKPLSIYYEDEVRKWLRCNPGKVVTLGNISSLFGAAFIHVANMKTAMKGFEATGIWPPNNNVFSDEDFLPSIVTDIVPSTLSTEQDARVNENVNDQHLNSETTEQATVVLNEPQCSLALHNQQITFPIESPENILPILKVKQTEKRNSRKRGKTAILTESPYKNDLEISLETAKKNKEEKEKKRQEKTMLTKKQLFKSVPKKKKKFTERKKIRL
ncbi:uncharacterized protein LOC100569212, partial [Acyrthosiphon pisum]|uniref:DDE-1 domain-containing protein n=1 Tax=Acyrthosiphon pisum TaxID=7029 RepID=A0A8R2FD68_ACYPI